VTFEPSLARRGLDLLLAANPHLELYQAEWQRDGRWLLVTLAQRSETGPALALHPYAIRKLTGAVHGMRDGAADDDPVLTP
jgi:hypothetical protein